MIPKANVANKTIGAGEKTWSTRGVTKLRRPSFWVVLRAVNMSRLVLPVHKKLVGHMNECELIFGPIYRTELSTKCPLWVTSRHSTTAARRLGKRTLFDELRIMSSSPAFIFHPVAACTWRREAGLEKANWFANCTTLTTCRPCFPKDRSGKWFPGSYGALPNFQRYLFASHFLSYCLSLANFPRCFFYSHPPRVFARSLPITPGIFAIATP